MAPKDQGKTELKITANALLSLFQSWRKLPKNVKGKLNRVKAPFKARILNYFWPFFRAHLLIRERKLKTKKSFSAKRILQKNSVEFNLSESTNGEIC